MYSFQPSDEQRMLMEAARRLAENDLRPAAHDADEQEQLPAGLIERGWELGLLQASVPEEYGGFGERSAVSSVLALEELAWGDLAAALAIMGPSSYTLPIALAGDDEQKERLLPPVVGGDWSPFTAAFIEPQFDFYPGDMQTKATLDGAKYRLSGAKFMVPYADQAPAFLVFASYDGTLAAFHVPAEAEGVELGERMPVLGIGALPLYSVEFDQVEIPSADRIGDDDTDMDPLLASAQVASSALAVGLSRAAYEYSLEYAKDREAFGAAIAQKQSIAFMLAEMATEIEAIRLLVWEAAWKLDQGLPATHSTYLALTGASDMAMMVTDRAVQILGGHGYIREHPVERWMRNGRGIGTFVGMTMV